MLVQRPLNVRILDIGTSKSFDGVLESLPDLYAIFGCDSVTGVNGNRKARWLSTVQNKEEYLQSVSQVGDAITVNADVFQKKLKNCFIISMKFQMKQI